MTPILVSLEPARQHDVARLLTQSDAVAARLYPGEYRRPITASSLAQPDTHVLVARLDGRAAGLCVVFDRGDATVEVKRMIVDAEARGQGVGRALLSAAHGHATALGAGLVLLEVGIRNLEAQALYRTAGYVPRGPFFPYDASPISLFMERVLLASDLAP
ncbi:GNAT family N-acetyltransferase [Acidisoma sp. 7E03]